MSTETNNFVAAIAQTNAIIPSLHNLAVETIKTFINPGIKDLEKTLLEDSERIFTQNNSLRCIAENSISEDIERLEGWIESTRERQRQHKDDILDGLSEIHEDIKECVGNPYDKKLYRRVADIEDTVDVMDRKIDRILEILEPEERKRRDRNERKRQRRREQMAEEHNAKKSKI